MKLTLYTWSGIGDSLMALPLIYALKSLGHEVILPSNQQALPFYEFLRDQEIISGIASYRHRSVVDWIRAFGNTDKLILPAGVERWQHPLLWALRKGAPAFGPFLRLGLRIKELETIEDVHEKSPSPKLPLASNRAQSYIHWIERYGLDFKLDWLFFEDRVLLKCRERIQKLLIGKGLEPGEYAILYPATIRAEKNMPEPLVNQIAEYCFERKIKLVFVGDLAPKNLGLDAHESVVDWSGRRDFGELAGLFSLSRAVFSVDGGLLHLALASRCPVVSFWGATIPDALVMPNHPYHHPLCRYLPFQPYEGEIVSDSKRLEAFNFSKQEIERAVQKADR
jgi:hypothetical protein